MHVHQRELFGQFDYRLRKLKTRTPQFFHAEWHRRARKTTAAINLLIKEACRVPKSKYVYISPTQVMTRNIVWDDPNMLRAYLPDKREYDWKLNEQKMLVTFANGSMIKFGGSDEPDSLRGIDVIGGVFDEWALSKPETWSEIFRPIVAGSLPPQLNDVDVFRWALFLYTPKGINHATQMFDASCRLGDGGELPDCGAAPVLRPNTYASRLDGEKSGILTQSEINRMQKEVARGEIPQAFYDQEIRCSRVTAEQMTLITSEMIYRLNEYHEKTRVTDKETRKIVSIDPAWGGDVCQIMGIVNHEVKEEKSIRDKLSTGDICQAAKLVAQDIGTKNMILDTVNAPGIADALEADAADYNVQRFKSSYKPVERKDTKEAITFANLRAQAYHWTAKLIKTLEAGPITDNELRRQLPIASKYTTQGNSGRLIILPKLKIKEELGCSPDKTDCLVMGNWGLQFVQPSGPEIVQFGAEALLPDYVGV